MLDWLGEADLAARLERATAAVIEQGQGRTYDMGGSNTSLDMAEAIAREL
jgi:3-isopropylmalate dehydrogenase